MMVVRFGHWVFQNLRNVDKSFDNGLSITASVSELLPLPILVGYGGGRISMSLVFWLRVQAVSAASEFPR